MRRYCLLVFCVSILAIVSCQKSPTQFQLLKPEESGIHFSNIITENDTLNILEYEYVYNGGGVALADFNQDGLTDIIFTGNQVPNRLYLNQGDLKFKDISRESGVVSEDRWSTGVSIVDINQDGLMDFYVCASVHNPGPARANTLWVNQGNNENGIPQFKEEASAFGIADTGHSTHAVFFDYDLDKDLDLYILTNEMERVFTPNQYRAKVTDGSNENTDRLYRNDGNGTFTDISKEAGILIEGYGLGVSTHDFNLDGWPDIYVTNDYLTNDLFYINNQDGTFTNKANEYLKHQSHSAMGHDVADMNNDGLDDILVMEMLPELNERKKRMVMANNYATYRNNDKFGYQHQYVRNTLQLNNGFTPEGDLIYSDIGHLSGVYQTDWSWSALFADMDHDGYRDILITNGFPKDITDQDFGHYRAELENIATWEQLNDQIPEAKLQNYAFHNQGDLTFEKANDKWGMNTPSFSNGAALGDLDNDGDLEYVVNNIDDSAFVYKNLLQEQQTDKHYLRIRLMGLTPNKEGLGAKILALLPDQKIIYQENSPYRGYMSSVEPIIHIGLGNNTRVDSLMVFWPDGAFQILKNVAADQVLNLSQSEAKPGSIELLKDFLGAKRKSIDNLLSSDKDFGIEHFHEEDDKIDFNIQKTLPHKFTQLGPGISIGDMNGDDLEDILIGSSAEKSRSVFLQQDDGSFEKALDHSLAQADQFEDQGLLLFDADGDGDNDLYASSGSYEFEPNAPQHQDRLFINKGDGSFEYEPKRLPEIRENSSCVKAADFDKDGDLDLFVGSRVKSGAYPEPVSSYVLVNENAYFKKLTHPELENIGMISDALWTDFNNDGWPDLILAGEWMPISVFENQEGKLVNITSSSGLANFKGWWNSLAGGDFDRDGDIDYVAGNLGLNSPYKASSEQPLSIYAADFDKSGSIDPIIGCYAMNSEGKMLPYPMHSRDDMIKQMNIIRRWYPEYKDFAEVTIQELIPDSMQKDMLTLEANHFQSSYIENLGNGKFSLRPLPMSVQMAPVFGILVIDPDLDGKLDIILNGNSFGTEVFAGRYDAMNGLMLRGNGTGEFEVLRPSESGLFIPGDGKAIAELINKQGEAIIIATQNQDSTLVFRYKPSPENKEYFPSIKTGAVFIKYPDGSTERRELYLGNSYFSQRGSVFYIPAGAEISEVK